MRVLAFVAGLLLAAQSYAANVTATTGWTTKADSIALGGTVTVDAGADWFFIFYIDREALVGWSGIPDCTLDMVQPTVEFEFDGGGAQRHHHVVWGWNAAAIATFNDGTPDVGTCDESTADISYLYGAVENTSTTTITAHTGTVDEAAADPSVTTTSSAGDLIICSAIDEDHTTTYTGWDTLTEQVDAAVDSTRHGYGVGNGGDTPTVIDVAAPTNASAACLVLADDVSISFTSGPTVAAATNGFTVSGTLSGAGTLTAYAVACFPGDADATNAQIEAGQCEGGDTAEISDNEIWTTDVADNFALTAAGSLQNYKVCVSGSDGTNDTAVTCSTNDRSANTGYQIDTLTTAAAQCIVCQPTDTVADTTLNSPIITGFADTSDFSAGGLVDVSAGFAETGALVSLSKTSTTMTVDVDSNLTSANVIVNGFVNEDGTAYWSPAFATGDIAECTTAADNGNTGTYDDGTVAMAADWDMVFTPDAGEEADFHVVECFFQDISDTVDGLFTQPNTPSGSPFYIYYNNVPPSCDLSSIGDQAYFGTWTAVDLDDLCSHSLGLTMNHYLRTGDTLHTSLTFTESTGVIGGGPITTENEAGLTVQLISCAGGKCTVSDWLAYFVNTFTVPNVVGQSLATALSTIETAAPWRLGGDPSATTTSCAASSGLVESQNPTAASEAAPYATITLTMDNGGICLLRRRN